MPLLLWLQGGPGDDPMREPNRHDTPNFFLGHILVGHGVGTLIAVLTAQGLFEIAKERKTSNPKQA
eukprot:CAMPEP_0178771890 /NCGR_PEP_ID=MMETSP0744-20121128/22219_1 /TAXON_ID=913974 /ORGANISM="Nitzschia punctata, Strain CCMP561" /LENGTH=65 /DNA_ID=CAMNT_0020428469 /DNA_START=1 /DNA_END=201 /DNA_ORIENTATION=+